MLEEAGRVLESVLERAPQHPQALARLGEISAARGEAPDAVASDTTASQLDATVVHGVTTGRLPEPSGPGVELDLGLDEQEMDAETTPASIELDLDGSSQRQSTVLEHGEVTFDLDLDESEESPQLEPPKRESKPPKRESKPPKREPKAPKRDSKPPKRARARPPEPEPPKLEKKKDVVAFELDLDDDESESLLEEAVPFDAAEENPFDLAAELESGISDDDDATATVTAGSQGAVTQSTMGFQQIFSAFKSAIEEQIGEKESEAHYDLGIAYREMGLLEDAIREFDVASRGDGRQLEALALLGTCKVEAGRPREALTDFQKALQVAGGNTEAKLALRYERAQALAACGETSRALKEFRAVQVDAPEFRDVAERIAELAGS
jgi:tetratricopeptide (TPR) repeat protein